ncbi:MAG: amidohydrolase family protein [Acidobacteriota bacterium]
MQPARSFAAAFAVALLLAPCAAWAAESEPIVVLRGATVHPIVEAPIENGVVVVQGGTILDVGTDVAVPAGARIVDLEGLHLYPGFVHAGSTLGLVEVLSVAGTRDFSEIGDFNPSLRAEVAFNADSTLLPVALSGGVLTAHVMPLGGVVAGTSAVMKLDGWSWRDMTLRTPVGQHLYFPSLPPPGGDSDDADAMEKAVESLDRLLDDARAYAAAREAGLTQPVDTKLEGLVSLVGGEQTLFVHADEARQIDAALDWVEEQGFDDVVLMAGPDVRHAAPRLAAAGIPVVLEGVLRLPERRWEPYDYAFTAAQTLHEAGVRFAISDGGNPFIAANARNLPFHAAMAVAFGLPREVALASVTRTAAEILGVDDQVGAIAPGLDASFFAVDGDPLEILSRIERVWVAGREIDLEVDPQQRLFRRYDARPRMAGGAERPDEGAAP